MLGQNPPSPPPHLCWDGKVTRITRPRDRKVSPESVAAVALGRLMIRALSQREGDLSSTIQVTTQHQRLANGESETLLLSYPNRKGVELKILTLDTPSPATGHRDSVGLDPDTGGTEVRTSRSR